MLACDEGDVAGAEGRLAARQWQELHPGGCEVMGVTRTRPDESREAGMRAEGITHRYRSDIEAAVHVGAEAPAPLELEVVEKPAEPTA